MARHDREDPHSLEEQLAWLDAIKENEETSSSPSVSTTVEETAASPYPSDPWLAVPAESDPPPLFRTAGSAYGTAEDTRQAPAEEPSTDDPLPTSALDTDPKGVFAAGVFNHPQGGFGAGSGAFAVPPPAAGDNEGFLAPLKPSPREGKGEESTPSRGLFEEPVREANTGETPAVAQSDRTTPVRPARKGKDAAHEDLPPELFGPRPLPPETAPAAPESGQGAAEPSGRGRSRAAEGRSQETFTDPSPRWPVPGPETTDPDGNRTRREPPAASEAPSRAEEPPAFPDTPAPRETPASREGTGAAPPPRETPAAREAPGFPPEPPAARESTGRPEPAPDEAEPAPYRARRRQSPPSPQPFAASAGRGRRPGADGTPTADSLDPDSLLRGRRNGPSGGWRKMVFKASGGLIKPGESPEVRRRRELISRARTPVAGGHHRVAVLSLKGGVGKTTTTVGLGATLASVRGDRVIAVDANPDRGTLSDKVELETSATVRDLLNERDQIKRYVDIRAFTSQAPSRLEVLASDRDPSVSEAFSAADYQAVAQVLENFYSICITDCGTGLLHSAMGGVLDLADQIVLVSSPSVDGARAASATLDWLEAHDRVALVRAATVVLCSVRPRAKSAVDIDKLEAHFAARCRAVIRVPYDPHLEEGAEIDLDRLLEPTREAYLRLAACIGDGFAVAPVPH